MSESTTEQSNYDRSNDNRSNNDQNKHAIKTVGEFFSEYHQTLHIPEYQRPYKWKEKNVKQLLEDIKYHSTKSLESEQQIPTIPESKRERNQKINYRLGAIVLHEEHNHDNDGTEIHNIVDGQQRTVTLLLLLKAFLDKYKNEDFNTIKNMKDIEANVNHVINKFEFPNEISHINIAKNFNFIRDKISQGNFTEKEFNFLLDHCELVIFKLTDISEAFQFFDSQNARGKGLSPHDLLKAFHLREFKDNLPGFSEDKKDQLIDEAVNKWESIISNDPRDMHILFSKYLYPTRCWVKNKKAFNFTVQDVDEFKGINFDKHKQYPYVKSLLTLYSQELNTGCKFNYQLDQPIINGYHFFEMVDYYHKKTATLFNKKSVELSKTFIFKDENSTIENKLALIAELNDHGNHGRQGDKYVRDMFDVALFYYFDKFINIDDIKHITKHDHQTINDIMNGIDYLYYWAYKIRLQNKSVFWESIENHICKNSRLFKRIKLSTIPYEVTNIEHEQFPPNGDNNSKYYDKKLKHLIINFKKKNLLIEEKISQES